MPVNCSGPSCDETLEESPPSISVDESPYWQLTRQKDTNRQVLGMHEFKYFCSDECVMEFIES